MGCSFTLGHEVEDTETWPYLLDEGDESTEILNLGVNAYGLDQCLLRYLRDGRGAEADEVWLGWLPAVSLRLGSMYRPAANHWSGPILFKPRYRMGDAALELIPNPSRSLAQTYRLLISQDQFLNAIADDDLWIRRARTAYAPMGTFWLHRTGLGRLSLAYSEKGGRDPAALLENEASEIRELVLRIVADFRMEAERDGSRFRLLVLPGEDALRFHRDEGRGYWDGVVAKLRLAGTEVIDLTNACLAAGMLDDRTAWQTGAHYSPAGNGIVATALKHAVNG
ncbi:MAG: hypothetical protein ACI8QZ_001901 [Chlamydiales bacterium]|jgi:hypothetical protein